MSVKIPETPDRVVILNVVAVKSFAVIFVALIVVPVKVVPDVVPVIVASPETNNVSMFPV